MHRVFMETAFTILFMAALSDGNTTLVREHHYVDSLFKSWEDARTHCSSLYTGFSTVLNEDDVEKVLDSVPNRGTTSAWIGLKRNTTEDHEGPWQWPGEQNADFEKWADQQPNSTLHHNCVYARDGRWYNQNCSDELPFYCSKTYNRTLTVVQEVMSWENALAYCRSNHTDLSSLLSIYTAEKVMNSTGVTTEFVWTGRRFLMGEWFWVDGETEEGDITWSKESHSQCPDMPLRCGALSVTERVFEARACEETLNFICYSQL